jgi:hypothetical protein|nr:MAG TPA: hypothetical protein [Caudoviricetes sp.]
MARIKGIYGKQLLEKTYKTFPFEGVWEKALGNPEVGGFWIILWARKAGENVVFADVSGILEQV